MDVIPNELYIKELQTHGKNRTFIYLIMAYIL